VSERERTHQVHELEALQQLAVLVLEAVGLIDDDTAPVHRVELRAAAQDHLERGDDRLELVRPPHHAALHTQSLSCFSLFASFIFPYKRL